MPDPVTDLGVDLIRAERERQITHEGYTPDHDKAHTAQTFVDAAIAYAYTLRSLWPWDQATFKPEAEDPTDDATVRDLVKAGALIAAAIDRHLAGQES
jgi:hypothetical protein